MSLTILTLLFILTATTTGTTTSSENLITTLKSKNITSVHLPSPSPETIRQFSNTNISLLLSIPNSLIPSFSSNTSATCAWLSSHVTPFLPHVRISAISVGNNVTDANLLKLVVIAVDNVIEKVNELGIQRVKVSTTVSVSFVSGSDSVAKGLLGSLSENGVTSLFVSMDYRNEPVGFGRFRVVGGYVRLISDSELVYKSLDNGEIIDSGIVETRVSRVEDMEIVMIVCFCFLFLSLEFYNFSKLGRF